MELFSLGADIGGSHITCQLINLQNLQPVPESKVRISVDPKASKNEIITTWVKAIRKATMNHAVSSLAGIGFAMPGPFDYPKGIALFDENVGKFQQLFGVNIKAEIVGKLHLPANFPVRFLNDATCFAIGETWLGEASKFNRVIALTLGTGFGTTFIEDGLPIAGRYGIPKDGFLYHIPFKNSIADEYFSTRWFTGEWEKQTGTRIVDVKNLVDLTDENDNALMMFQQFGNNLGEFMAHWVKSFKAECLVLGGNITKSAQLFLPGMKKQLEKIKVQPEVYISSLGEDAALIGSARLCDNDYYSKLHRNKI